MKIPRIIISLAICALALCGCHSSDSDKSEVLSLNETTSTGECSIDSQVVVTLEGNPTTGYEWEVASFDPNLLTFEGGDYVNKKMELTGSGGFHKFYFRSKAEGIAVVKFNYARPWETAQGGRPLKTEEVKVTIKAK